MALPVISEVEVPSTYGPGAYQVHFESIPDMKYTVRFPPILKENLGLRDELPRLVVEFLKALSHVELLERLNPAYVHTWMSPVKFTV